MKKQFTEEQIIGFLRCADAGVPVKELCRMRGFLEASYYLWRSKFSGMEVSDAKRLKALEAENAKPKKLLAESMLENEVEREALRKMVTASAHRELIGLPTTTRSQCGSSSPHRCSGSAQSTLRRRHDPSEAQPGGRRMRELQARGAAVLDGSAAYPLPPSQEDAGRRTRCADPPRVGERDVVNGFLHHRVGLGRTTKCLVIVDDVTQEAVAVVPGHTIGGDHLTHILDDICYERDQPKMIRTDN